MENLTTIKNSFADLAIILSHTRNIDDIRSIKLDGLNSINRKEVFQTSVKLDPSNWIVVKDGVELYKDVSWYKCEINDFEVRRRDYIDQDGKVQAVMIDIFLQLEDGLVLEDCTIFFPEYGEFELQCKNPPITQACQFLSGNHIWKIERLLGFTEPDLWLHFYVPKDSVYRKSKYDLPMSCQLLTIENGNFFITDMYCGGLTTDESKGLIDQPGVHVRVKNVLGKPLAQPLDSYSEPIYGLLKVTGFQYDHCFTKPETTGEIYEKFLNSPGYKNPVVDKVVDSKDKTLSTKLKDWFRNL